MTQAQESKIFSSYLGLGLYCNHIPLAMCYIEKVKKILITTVVGNSFHTYFDPKFCLNRVGFPHPNPITCLAVNNMYTFSSCKTKIYAWRGGSHLINTYEDHKDDIILLIPFGIHIVSVDKKNILYIWNITSKEKYLEMEFSDKFLISCMIHPATYINKILLGSKQGKLQLWNVHTNKLIYTFKGWNSEVTVLEQCPALDVVAIGLLSGEIYLHNLKFDETIVKFRQDWGAVTCISFRTDGVPHMVSGSMMGHVAIWDLEEKSLSSQILNAHSQAVTGLKCFPNEPRMVTSSPDNSITVWIFDLPGGGARKVLGKEGNSSPPLTARFHGASGESILVAGEDSTLRVFSTVFEGMNTSFGTASFNKKIAKTSRLKREELKMPPIVNFTSETVQENPWDNIACIHRNSSCVSTWSFESKSLNDLKLLHDRFKTSKFINSIATCLELSVCGNFVIIGYDSGHIDMYNIQSGLYRGSYVDENELAHSDSVRGIVADGLNQVVVSGDQLGCLKWWKFKLKEKLSELNLKFGISLMKLHRDSNLLVIAFDNWSLKVVDIDTKAVIRHLVGHKNQITDVTFTPNSKWLISASLDLSIRTWDLPSNSCVDIFCIPVAASSISMSPTGEFLATIHAGHLGVYLWSNRMFFQNISVAPVPEDFVPPVVALPTSGSGSSDQSLEEDVEEEEFKMEVEEEYKSPEQIAHSLVTLALLPTSRWLNLLHIDTIKKRNRPVEPLKVPKSAPFFIPTVPGLDFKFGEEQKEGPGDSVSRLKRSTTFESLTPFGEKLKEKKYEAALMMLMKMGPAAIDVEVRELDPEIGGSEEVLLNFLRMIKFSLDNRKYFEVTQGYLGLFLKVHADFIIENEDAQEVCQKLLNSHHASWHVLKNSFNQSLSLISYFKNAAVLNY